MNKLIISFLIVLSSTLAFSQSKAKIKKHKIKSTSTEISTIEGGETKVVKESETYDAAGHVIEESKYINGRLKSKETFKFNKNGNPIEHSIYDSDGNIKKKSTKKYNINNDIIEQYTYDINGKLLKKEITNYNPFNEKTTEITYNGQDQMIQKEVYSYDERGLKKDKLTYNSENKLIEKKIYTFITK